MAGNNDGEGLKDQLKSMKEDLKALKNRRDDLPVDDALSSVSSLASRPSLTSYNVSVAAIETLIEVANKANHKDASLFSKSCAICKRYEDNEDLVLKLFGTLEDKKIAADVDGDVIRSLKLPLSAQYPSHPRNILVIQKLVQKVSL